MGLKLASFVTPLPFSDEKGGSGVAADGKRDNARCGFEQSLPVLRHEFLSLSHRYAMPAPSSEGAKRVTIVIRNMSFAALDLWAAKRGFGIS